MRYLGGHLGTAASALVDGQLDPAAAERAWSHVHCCAACRRLVEREGWIKTQLATMAGDEPPERLIGSLYGLGGPAADRPGAASRVDEEAAAWAAVDDLERRSRGRRRTGIALAGAGSVSVAVFGIASLSGATLGIGSSPVATPTATPSSALASTTARPGGTSVPTLATIAPGARAHGRLPGARPGREGDLQR